MVLVGKKARPAYLEGYWHETLFSFCSDCHTGCDLPGEVVTGDPDQTDSLSENEEANVNISFNTVVPPAELLEEQVVPVMVGYADDEDEEKDEDAEDVDDLDDDEDDDDLDDAELDYDWEEVGEEEDDEEDKEEEDDEVDV
jgi:segregation and condensation protein B